MQKLLEVNNLYKYTKLHCIALDYVFVSLLYIEIKQQQQQQSHKYFCTYNFNKLDCWEWVRGRD